MLVYKIPQWPHPHKLWLLTVHDLIAQILCDINGFVFSCLSFLNQNHKQLCNYLKQSPDCEKCEKIIDTLSTG